jgi:hypothetical protein
LSWSAWTFLPFLRIRHWQIGRLDKRSIGFDGVQVAANCTGGMTKSAAFFFDPRSRQLAVLYADSQLEKGGRENKAIIQSEGSVSSPISYLIHV